MLIDKCNVTSRSLAPQIDKQRILRTFSLVARQHDGGFPSRRDATSFLRRLALPVASGKPDWRHDNCTRPTPPPSDPALPFHNTRVQVPPGEVGCRASSPWSTLPAIDPWLNSGLSHHYREQWSTRQIWILVSQGALVAPRWEGVAIR